MNPDTLVLIAGLLMAGFAFPNKDRKLQCFQFWVSGFCLGLAFVGHFG